MMLEYGSHDHETQSQTVGLACLGADTDKRGKSVLVEAGTVVVNRHNHHRTTVDDLFPRGKFDAGANDARTSTSLSCIADKIEKNQTHFKRIHLHHKALLTRDDDLHARGKR